MAAQMITMNIDLKENASPVVVSSYSSIPALMNPKDGGATPMNVPIKNCDRGTFSTGDVMLINQFGRNGVIRRKVI